MGTPLSWEEYFMELAKLSARRSKDPNTKVGACIISPDKRIIAIGYNGMPRNCPDNEYPWSSPEKYQYVVHAELNALMNANDFHKLRGATLYSTLFPCNECAKAIIQLGISEIVYLEDKYHEKENYKASRRMLGSAGIIITQYDELFY